METRSHFYLVMCQSVIDRVREALEQHPTKFTMENRECRWRPFKHRERLLDGCLELFPEPPSLTLVPAISLGEVRRRLRSEANAHASALLAQALLHFLPAERWSRIRIV